MRFTLSLLLTGLALAMAPLQAAEMIRDYPVHQVSASTHVILGPMGYPSVENQGFMNNPAWVITEQGVIVIDPGSSVQAGRRVMQRIRAMTDKPVTHVFSTHVHGDHWLGNQAINDIYPDAVIMGHAEMIRQAREGAAQRWLDFMAKVTEGYTNGTKAVIPQTQVANSDTLQLNGKTFRIHAPGKAHSGTDIMIEFVDESVLFTGDNVLSKRLARLDDATFKGGIDACEVAVAIGAKHYVPGHGPTGGVETAQAYLNYLRTIYDEARRLYDENLQAYEMKPLIAAKLKSYHDWANYKDEFGRHVSLAVLEAEADAF